MASVPSCGASLIYHIHSRSAYHCCKPEGWAAAVLQQVPVTGHSGAEKPLWNERNWELMQAVRARPKIWPRFCDLIAPMVQGVGWGRAEALELRRWVLPQANCFFFPHPDAQEEMFILDTWYEGKMTLEGLFWSYTQGFHLGSPWTTLWGGRGR